MSERKVAGIGTVKVTEAVDVAIRGEPSRSPHAGMASRLGGQNIVTVEVPKNRTVQAFAPAGLKDTRGVRYSDVRGGIQDPTITKNSRFRLSELARGPLSVEAEEEQRIAGEVERRLQAKIEEIRRSISKEAYQEGLRRGSADGQQSVLAQAKPMFERWDALIASFEGLGPEIFRASEELIIRMVYQLARAVILRELKEDRDYTRRLVLHLLERLGTRENVKIFVGQQEYSAAEALKGGLAQSLGELKNISVEMDPSIESGGCRIETDFGEVDARIEVQIQSIAQAMGVSQK